MNLNSIVADGWSRSWNPNAVDRTVASYQTGLFLLIFLFMNSAYINENCCARDIDYIQVSPRITWHTSCNCIVCTMILIETKIQSKAPRNNCKCQRPTMLVDWSLMEYFCPASNTISSETPAFLQAILSSVRDVVSRLWTRIFVT